MICSTKDTRGGCKSSDISAFTLIELLVIIGLILLLAVTLLPALARTQTANKSMQCINNLKNWSRAEYIAASENNDNLPRDGMSSAGTYPGSGANGTPLDPNAWFNSLPPYLSESGLSNYWNLPGSDPRLKLPFPGNSNSARFWHCPAATMSSTDYAALSGGGANGFFSYCMNIDLKQQTSFASYPYPLMPKLSAFRRPGATVLFFDAAFNPRTEVINTGPQFNSVNPANRWRSFTWRHVNGAAISFLDGQARIFRMSYVTNGAGSNEALKPDIIWNAPYRVANP